MHTLSRYCLFTASLLLSACSVEPLSQQDITGDNSNASILNAIKGPNVQGIEKTLLESALSALDKGDPVRAAQFYEQLMDKYPDKVEYKIGIADARRRSGNNDEALAMFEEILNKNPQNAAALEGKGLTLMAQGEFPQAGTTLSEVMKIEPDRWRTLNAIGILFVSRSMVDEAMQYYNQALKVGNNPPSVLNNMGLSYALDKDYENAIKSLEKATARITKDNPEKKRFDLNLALVYGLAGQMEDAQRVSSPYLTPEAVNNNLGYYAYLANNESLAKSYLNMALSHSPTFYSRAWENLDEVNSADTTGGKMIKAKRVKVPEVLATMPKPDVKPEKKKPTKSVEKVEAAPEENKAAKEEKPVAAPVVETKKAEKMEKKKVEKPETEDEIKLTPTPAALTGDEVKTDTPKKEENKKAEAEAIKAAVKAEPEAGPTTKPLTPPAAKSLPAPKTEDSQSFFDSLFGESK